MAPKQTIRMGAKKMKQVPCQVNVVKIIHKITNPYNNRKHKSTLIRKQEKQNKSGVSRNTTTADELLCTAHRSPPRVMTCIAGVLLHLIRHLAARHSPRDLKQHIRISENLDPCLVVSVVSFYAIIYACIWYAISNVTSRLSKLSRLWRPVPCVRRKQLAGHLVHVQSSLIP